jgi:hypothetical protein
MYASAKEVFELADVSSTRCAPKRPLRARKSSRKKLVRKSGRKIIMGCSREGDW